ncbi:MAG: hypothetical protein ACPHID_05445 [Thermoplasmatota archaeon]
MNPLDLSPSGGAWIRLLLGTLLYLLPGFVASQRWMRGPLRWLMTPVLAFSLNAVTAMALDLALGIPITATTTAVIAVAWTVALARGTRWQLPAWRPWLPLLVILPLVAMSQAMPHVPGEDGSAWDAYGRLAERSWQAISGDDIPFPVHVDEYMRMSHASQIAEDGRLVVPDPYTGEPASEGLFSIAGLRGERGFALAMAQIHLLTDASLPFIARVLPSLWAAYTAGIVYAALRPLPGAALAGAGSIILPNTARWLGSGFLVPSNFALAWVFAALWIVRSTPRRYQWGLQSLLVTAAFSLHLVQGTLTLGMLVLAHALDERPGRAERIAGTLLPLIWLLPPLWQDAQSAVAGTLDLPFQVEALAGIGALLLGAFVVASAAAYMHRADPGWRTIALFTGLLGLSIVWSVATDHRSDATYTRLLFAFLLGLAATTALGIGRGVQWAAQRFGKARAWKMGGVALAIVLAAPGLGHALDEDMYRIYDAESWSTYQRFVATQPEGTYLSEPWQAPIGTYGTDARPYTVLYPGSPPYRGDAWTHYVTTGGADETWLKERGIDYVLGPIEPNAPNRQIATNVWQLS